MPARSCFKVWDNREVVSTHSTALDAHRTILTSRHASPDSGRRLWLYDTADRIVATYTDGREDTDGLDGSAFGGNR
jgi:hypothetical protein